MRFGLEILSVPPLLVSAQMPPPTSPLIVDVLTFVIAQANSTVLSGLIRYFKLLLLALFVLKSPAPDTSRSSSFVTAMW